MPNEMLDVINNILQNSRPIQPPPTKLRHLWTYPQLHAMKIPGICEPIPFPIPGCDLMYFDLYESHAGARYLRQSDGILGETIWYQQNEPTPVGSASADATEQHETNP